MDAIRNAPSISIITELQKEGAALTLYDPEAMENMRKIFPESQPGINYTNSPYEAVKNANAALFVTEWDEFKQLDLAKVRDLMVNPIIIDGRNIFKFKEIQNSGFEYYSIGRK